MPVSEACGRLGMLSPLTVPEHTGLVGEGRRSAGPLAPDLHPGLNQRLVHPRGDAQLGDPPVPGGAGLVLAIAEGQARALGQQGSPPGGLLQFCDRGGFAGGCQPPAARRRCRRTRACVPRRRSAARLLMRTRVERLFDLGKLYWMDRT